MDFRELAYIVSIAKHQSVSKAAEELFVTQPTLSKFVQNLEKELDQPLFRRLGNKFLLTYAGERYVEKARTILAEKKELDQELSDIIHENVGELKIAFPIMRGTYMIPNTLPVFRKQFPRVKVNVIEESSAVLEEMLLSGDIDLAFFTLPIRSPKISHEIISQEEVVLVMAQEHPLVCQSINKPGCRYPWIDAKLLENEEFILQMPDQRTRENVDKIFLNAGINPNKILEIRNILASVQLAVDGYGMTFVGETHLRHMKLNRTPSCFSVGSPITTTSFVAAYRQGVYLPYYTHQFIQIVKDFT